MTYLSNILEVKFSVKDRNDLISRATNIMSQQIWCWGRDISRDEGNLFLKNGFERIEPPLDMKGEVSIYRLNFSEKRHIILRGFGVYYFDARYGAIFVPRFEFLPVYTKKPCSTKPIWRSSDLPDLDFPGKFEWDYYNILLRDLLNWITVYEQDIIDKQGLSYRKQTLMEWDDGFRKIIEPENIPNEWKEIAKLFSKIQHEDFFP